VVQQQDANGLSSDAWHQSPFDRFFGHQSHGPTRLAFWRIAAYHGDDALFLVGVQHFGRAGALFLIQSTIQSGLLIAMAEASNCLRRERDSPGNLRGAGVLS
jgi:hypothetical protein